jgi:arsenate reductase (thioredoxin)
MAQSKSHKVLFLCTGNSCRSQMAEGWTRALKGDVIEVYSAGIKTHGLNQTAVEVMAEVGVDISTHVSKYVDTLRHIAFDAVITVCDNAWETCPFFPGAKKTLHVGFADPPTLAKTLAAQGAGGEEQRNCYRRVRDEIRAFVETLPDGLHLQENHE